MGTGVFSPGGRFFRWRRQDARICSKASAERANFRFTAPVPWRKLAARVKNALFQLLAALVAGGGVWADRAGESHWAFQPLLRPDGDSVDAFVERKLRTGGLEIGPQAESRRLLRRVHLTLTGLPPSPEESVAFAENPDLEAAIDDLLTRPLYGERWGQHWLDLARYADSNGLHEDTDRPHAWRYRDYVIDSFNADKPYGQFIREQLAGDEIDPQNPAAWIATGFCRNGPSNEENVAKNEVETYRLDQLDDVLATTTQVFLGQTIACARCHDHKTEPFTLTDYYRLLAVFDNTVAAYVPWADQLGEPQLRPVVARGKKKPPKERHIRALTSVKSKPRVTHVLFRGNWQTPGDAVTGATPEILGQTPLEGRKALADWIAAPENPLTWRVMANRLWQHHFGRGLVATPSDFGTKGAKPTHPQLLDWLACELRDNGGRLKPLHKLIVLSRAYRQSSAPRPHGELFSHYPAHRLEAEVVRDAILLSSGNLNLEMGGPGIKPQVPPEILGQSKRNQWPRVEKESAKHWRRSVYVYRKRQLPMPLLTLFDAPDGAQSCAKRFVSTTPTQALALLNDVFVNKQARYLAVRAMEEENPIRTVMKRALALPVTAQQLGEAEEFVAQRLGARRGQREAEKLALANLAVVLFNSSQFVHVD